MILIASAAYVNAEFQVEFGRLPPAFLPVGNRRLFEYQIETLRHTFGDQSLFLSLPNSYKLNRKDRMFLERAGVRVLRSDETLSLAEAIEYAVTEAGAGHGELRLLHGDTWVSNIPRDQLECIGIVDTSEDYAWEVEGADNEGESVWCGYFSFGDSATLLDALRRSHGSFARAVRLYDSIREMSRVRIDGWHDFGHVNTYFQSRAKITTERAFNELIIADGCVRKTGRPFEKIKAEYEWFRALPHCLRVFCPQLIEFGTCSEDQPFYILEYLPLPPLNELYVHGRNPVFFWGKVFRTCGEFLARCASIRLNAEQKEIIAAESVSLAREKTWKRLEAFVEQVAYPGLDVATVINGISLPSLREITTDCIARIRPDDTVPGLLHGDLCFSNILFDSRTDRIKLVDPRGLDSQGRRTNIGDLRYDLAKLSHSVIGLYDYIVAGAYDLAYALTDLECSFSLDIQVDERIANIQDMFRSQAFFGGRTADEVLPLTILLFLSMLPLHSDNPRRQIAMLANALRLYVDCRGDTGLEVQS